MLKQLKYTAVKQKRRTGIIICAICIAIAAAVIFIAFELENNRSYYISNYAKQQQKLTDQVALRMKHYLESEQLQTLEIIDEVISEVETSGSSFWFVANGEDLVFVKNKESSGLFTYISLTAFLQDNTEDGMHISYHNFNIGDEKYTVGICTTLDFIMEEGLLFKHNLYILMPVLLISSILIVLIIIGLLIINKQENLISKLNLEAIDRNITIEQIAERYKKARMNDPGETRSQNSDSKEKVIYNKEVLISLLDKINRENVVPLTIVVIELSSKHKDLVSEDYHRMIKSVSNFVHKEHVLAEIFPGVFTILMFHTVAQSKEDIKKNLIEQWALPLKKNGIKLRMGISCIEKYDADVENVFEIVSKEVSGKMQADKRLKLSS
jgi:uncharacterized membrane protein